MPMPMPKTPARSAVSTAIFVASTALITGTAHAGKANDTFKWMSETTDVQAEGILWNDGIGDGKDQYKTGGMTQSFLIPESVFSTDGWVPGAASALEIQGRGFIATPENTAAPVAGDRPFSQYVGIGAYLRTFSDAEPAGPNRWLTTENRIGIELGLQGEPLPLFEIQEALHGMTGMGRMAMTSNNTLPTEVLVNLDAKRTWRYHLDFSNHDFEFAPYAMGSIGMRETSLRAGFDLIIGSALTARTWNHDQAIGALIPGGSAQRNGFNWTLWAGADAGVVLADALLDGGFAGSGPGVQREQATVRARAGLMLEYDNLALTYSATYLSPEFSAQSEGQVIGAVSVKVRF